MRALILKEFRELGRDRRTLAMLIALPVILLVIFGYAASFRVDQVSVAVVGPGAKDLSAEVASSPVGQEHLRIERVDETVPGTQEQARQLLERQEYDVVLVTLVDDVPAAAISPAGQSHERPLNERMHAYGDGSALFMAQAARSFVVELAAHDAQESLQSQLDSLTALRADLEEMRGPLENLRSELTGLGEFAPGSAGAPGAPGAADLLSVQGQVPGQTPTAGDPSRGVPSDSAPGAGQLPPGELPPGQADLAALLSKLGQVNLPALPDLPDLPTVPNLEPEALVTVLFNPDLSTSWVMVPPLVGLVMVFIGVLITSIGLVRERETGTLEQLAVMPLRPADIILGKITPYFLLAVLDIAVVTVIALLLFRVPFEGSALLFAGGVFLFAFVVLGLGVFISSISHTTGQAIQTAIMMVVPQIILSGLIYPLETMPAWIRTIGYCLPLTWFRQFSLGVMLRGAGLETMWLPLAVLAGMAVTIFGAATLRMRFSLAHGGGR
ncbi:MAG: ABC transporter permease [Buchananella hordeovulneris]|nr:ABC transporter permease [Buchananella hordeovulneris]